MRLFGAGPEVAGHAEVYLRVSLLGLPGLLLVLAGTGYLRGLRDVRTPLVVSLVSAAGNFVAELVLVHGLGFGIGASALTTVVAQWGAALWYLRVVGRDAGRRRVRLRPHAATLRRLLVVAGALVVRTAALRLSLVLATAVAGRLGVVDLGAHQIAFEVWSLLALALDAVAIAGQAITGTELGAGRLDAARDAARRMVTIGVATGVVAAVAVLAVRPVLPAVFTTDADVRALTAFLLLWVAVLQPLNAVVFVLDGILIGAGDLAFLARAMVGAALCFVAAAVAVLVTGAGIGWLWAAIGVLMAARALPLAIRLRSGRWAVAGAAR